MRRHRVILDGVRIDGASSAVVTITINGVNSTMSVRGYRRRTESVELLSTLAEIVHHRGARKRAEDAARSRMQPKSRRAKR